MPSPAVSPRRRTPVRRPLPLVIIIIPRAIVDPFHLLHLGHLPTAGLCPVTTREDKRVPIGRVRRTSPDRMSSCLPRVPSPWEENDNSGLFAGPAGSCWIGPRSSSYGTGGGRPGRCRPGSRQRLGHRWRPGNTQRHGHRQRPGHRWRLRHRWRPGHRGRPGHSGRPGQWRPSGCLGSWVRSQFRATVWWTGRGGWPSTPSNRRSGRIGRTWNPGSYHARGWIRRLQVYRDQQPAFPFHSEIHQSGNAGRLYVYVDVTTASDGPVQCSSCSSLSSGPVSSAGSQTWLNQQEISHAG